MTKAEILNEDVFMTLRELMDEPALADLYRACLEQTRQRAEALRSAPQANLAVREIAHSLRGSVSMLGAKALASIAEELEESDVPAQQAVALSFRLIDGCDLLENALLMRGVQL